MTASTNTVLVRTDDGIEEYSGVIYAEEAFHSRLEEPGVALQYKQYPGYDGPETEFIVDGELVGVYDDSCDEPLEDDYHEAVTN